MQSLKIPQQLKCIATLPCETSCLKSFCNKTQAQNTEDRSTS